MRFQRLFWATTTLLTASLAGAAFGSAAVLSPALSAVATPALDLDFDEGVDSWRVVLDGVMGGRSSGRITQGQSDQLVFTGDLSLENNGGFSQIRTNIPEGTLGGQDGLEIKVLGDGRTYQFDIRVSNVRLMAGGFQTNFETVDGEWAIIELPFDDFELYSFGRRVPRAPELDPGKIESIGITLADKNKGAFRIELDSIRSYSGAGASAREGSGTGLDSQSAASAASASLGQVAKDAGLDTLLTLVGLSGIELPVGERVTLFAPSEAAFAKLPKDTVDFLVSPDGRDQLRTILSNHIVSGTVRSNELLNRRSLTSLAGQSLAVGGTDGLSIDDARFVGVDVAFDQGIVHVIDTVLVPESRSILELASATEQLSTLEAAIGRAGIGSQLSNENGPWTVFAPVNSAFADLPEGVLEQLLEAKNRTRLIDLLGLHIIPGRIGSSELLGTRSARTYFGNKVEFTIKDGGLSVDGARILATDIQAANGVIHLIDRVILPKEPKTKKQAAPGSSPLNQVELNQVGLNQEAVRLYELAISRGVPLFNAGQESACASIYEITIESMVALGTDSLDRRAIEQLEMGLAEAEAKTDPAERAWIFRRALDRAAQRFSQAD